MGYLFSDYRVNKQHEIGFTNRKEIQYDSPPTNQNIFYIIDRYLYKNIFRHSSEFRIIVQQIDSVLDIYLPILDLPIAYLHMSWPER